MTDYSVSDLSHFRLFLLQGDDVGFAIKSDGDIVAVFNNSSAKKIGKEIISQAIKNGGTKLDHFDGYLTGFYSSMGFKSYHRDLWNQQYAPDVWKYEPIDIFSPKTSDYAVELKSYSKIISPEIYGNYLNIGEKELICFVNIMGEKLGYDLSIPLVNYRQGKPSIIYRKL